MKTISHTSTLFYFDGPQVIEARDAIGGHYIGVMVEPDAGRNRYLIAGVEPERLRQFRSGLLDLRSLLSARSETQWYLGIDEMGLDHPLDITLRNDNLEDSGYLPDAGFLLHDHPTDTESLKEARERNSLVLEVAVDPPEAAEEHRIRVGTLAGLLSHLQVMVRHAYRTALRELPQGARRSIDSSDAHLLDVVIPAAAGSFRLLLAAAKSPDLLGQSELGRAMHSVDVFFANANDPQQALATAKAHKGHLAGAYLRLLRFLVQHNTGLRYSWAEPSFSAPNCRSVSAAEAGPLVDLLSGISNLGAESLTVVGSLKKADVDSGSWRIATEDGDYSGKIREGGPSLAGLKLESAYRFSCVEEIEEVQGSGREQRTLYLIEHEPV